MPFDPSPEKPDRFPHTFADLRDFVLELKSHEISQRVDVASSLKAFLERFPIAADLRPHGRDLKPLLNKLPNDKYSLNIRSNVRRALDWLHAERGHTSTTRQPLSGEWGQIWTTFAKNSPQRARLSRFFNWNQRRGALPANVTSADVEQFGEYVEAVGVGGHKRKYQIQVVGEWNKLRATAPDWRLQKLELPHSPKPRRTERGDFDLAFLRHCDDYANVLMGKASITPRMKRLVSETVKAPRRKSRRFLSQTSAELRLHLIKRAGYFLAKGKGIALTDITSLNQLIEPEAAEIIIDEWARHLKLDAPGVYGGAWALLDLVNTMFPEDKAARERITTVCGYTTPPPQEISEANIELLLALGAKQLSALYQFPAQAMAKVKASIAKKGHISQQDVVLAQSAVCVAILLFAPIRVNNLARLRLNEQLFMPDKEHPLPRIRIFRKENKSRVFLIYTLPERSRNILDWYINDILPHMAEWADPNVLFPGQGSTGFKHKTHLGANMSACLKRLINLSLNPHFFRHLVAHLYLTEHPGAYEKVRVILGQKNVETTKKYYCGLEMPAVMEEARACFEKLADRLEMQAVWDKFEIQSEIMEDA